MLCFDSLKDLYETNIDNCSLAASLDSQCQNEKRKQPLGMKNDTNYFGAGMLLINLKYWRENKIEEKSFEYIRINSEKLLWHDQDTLNAVLEGSTKTVDFNYNFYDTFLKSKTNQKCLKFYGKKSVKQKRKFVYSTTYRLKNHGILNVNIHQKTFTKIFTNPFLIKNCI